MKYKFSQSSLTNIHKSCMEKCWAKKASVLSKSSNFQDTYLHHTSLAPVVGHWSHTLLLKELIETLYALQEEQRWKVLCSYNEGVYV